jgi:excisionase family DNA binding protein
VTPLLTVDDVAAELQVPRRTAYLYMQAMMRVVTGRHVRVSREALDAWIAARTQEPASERMQTASIEQRPGPRRVGPRLPDIYVTQPRRRRAQ